ncbi:MULTISPECIES: hypothetical protein [Bacillus cereus group]|jgi:hypothetical protein|uniref:Uncharacterized protein n=13 Tax=Bacillus TaxID=1386 RepID=A0A6L8PQB0_BACAN|nr:MULTISPECIES: hypothetical protein [Bacillus cereus group]AAP27348.1 conserved hypothetical protein [Bacillus anthracis str. Ames]AAT32702.1 conserved hypothetical protein [Bacillus anthracis str. 'Ames Ancestor']AAT55639.1 conserved hypothetical protein [Bacillus anthracis str. Sterne]AUD21695.1 hypothetical protein CU648_03910 [Bacillus sp. HBCD-sjtu]EEM88426.1 hypothetical protein bthur0012_33660 [Bacillus thuringiensis serovar pulsiensis BGSC 4CC1]OTW51421.1 hypothetical protein BK699_
MEYFIVFSMNIHRKECSLMEAIFNILTVLAFGIIFTALLAFITLPFIAKKKNWKRLNISLNRGVLKIKIEE